MTESNVLPNDADGVLLDILDDYENKREIFGDTTAEDADDTELKQDVEGLVADDVIESDREQALYLTYNLAINYNKPAQNLRRRIRGLRRSEPWIFHPEIVAGEQRYDELLDLFKGRGEYSNHPVLEEYGLMEGGKTDTNYWYTIADTLYRDFDSDPLALIDAHDGDAYQVYRHVREERREEPAHEKIRTTKQFPGLGGPKIAPLWLRTIHDLVRPLENMALLPIPVDRHIADITSKLFDREYSADNDDDREEIQELYREFCEANSLSATTVDRPIWLIGESRKEGGQEYLERKLNRLPD